MEAKKPILAWLQALGIPFAVILLSLVLALGFYIGQKRMKKIYAHAPIEAKDITLQDFGSTGLVVSFPDENGSVFSASFVVSRSNNEPCDLIELTQDDVLVYREDGQRREQVFATGWSVPGARACVTELFAAGMWLDKDSGLKQNVVCSKK